MRPRRALIAAMLATVIAASVIGVIGTIALRGHAPTSVAAVRCPLDAQHAAAPKWSASTLALPQAGVSGLFLSRADIVTALRVFASDPLVRRVFAAAGVVPKVVRVYRVFVDPRTERSVPVQGTTTTAHVRMAWVAATGRPGTICVPGPHPEVLFDTEHVRTADPRGYETWENPGAYLHASGLDVYVDLQRHVVAGVVGAGGGGLSELKGFEVPRSVTERVPDMSD